MSRSFLAVFALVLVGCAPAPVPAAPAPNDPAPVVTEPFSCDIFLVVDVVSREPRGKEVEQYIELARKGDGKNPPNTSLSADNFQVLPVKFFIPARSTYSTTQRLSGEYRLDKEKLAASEKAWRQAMGTEERALIFYFDDAQPHVGERGMVCMNTAPGAPHHGVPAKVTISWVPWEGSEALIRSLKMDASYPTDVVWPPPPFVPWRGAPQHKR